VLGRAGGLLCTIRRRGVWVVGPALFVFLGSVVGGVSGGAGDGELDFGCKIRNSLLTA